ncbi:MAG: AAA family ATPase [Oscillospiraceae bacterium]|nr:AAA family ATPase [Oscillospiraceae bacterium]
MKNNLTVPQKISLRLAELSATGIAIVVLRCERQSDLHALVAAYAQQEGLESSVYQATALHTVRKFGSRFEWRYHGLTENELCQEDRSLMQHLETCTGLVSGRERRVLYIPDLIRLVGADNSQRTNLQKQYLELMTDIALNKQQGRGNVLIIAGCTDGQLCPDLKEFSYLLDVPYPEPEEIRDILLDICTQCGGAGHELEPDKANRLTQALRGFRESEIRSIIRLAYASSPYPMRDMAAVLAIIHDMKRQKVNQVKGLRWVEHASPVGGMEELQDFLRTKGTAFKNPHLAQLQCAQPPQAVLLYGPPGCGKSLASDWAAILLGGEEPLPLLHLSLTGMLERWVGQSEANYEMAMQAVEGIAPCVLVIEELEKLFGKVDKSSSSEVSSNLFSLFLQWMEKPKAKPILVMASANREEELPPEADRKGRFDEIFSVSVPTGSECREIIRLHLAGYENVLEKTVFRARSAVPAIDYLADVFVEEAARQKRFLTGADIKGICKMVFAACFNRYYQSMDEQQKKDAMKGTRPHRYSTKEVEDILKEELAHTRTFLDSKMPVAANYWIQSYLTNSRPASGQVLIRPDEFDPETGRVAPSAHTLSRYDSALRDALAAAIADQWKKRR